MVHTANYRHLVPGVSVRKRLNLYEFSSRGRDLIFFFREGPYYRIFLGEMYENLETVRAREVSVWRDSTANPFFYSLAQGI